MSRYQDTLHKALATAKTKEECRQIILNANVPMEVRRRFWTEWVDSRKSGRKKGQYVNKRERKLARERLLRSGMLTFGQRKWLKQKGRAVEPRSLKGMRLMRAGALRSKPLKTQGSVKVQAKARLSEVALGALATLPPRFTLGEVPLKVGRHPRWTLLRLWEEEGLIRRVEGGWEKVMV